MSLEPRPAGHVPHGDHDHVGHEHHGHDDAAHGTRQSYLVGFGLSVVLTVIPFWLVMSGGLTSKEATALIVMAFAAVQVVVHMIYFLHMNTRSEGGWTMLALIFTVILVGVALSGSLWVMFHLTSNMMPTAADMNRLP